MRNKASTYIIVFAWSFIAGLAVGLVVGPLVV